MEQHPSAARRPLPGRMVYASGAAAFPLRISASERSILRKICKRGVHETPDHLGLHSFEETTLGGPSYDRLVKKRFIYPTWYRGSRPTSYGITSLGLCALQPGRALRGFGTALLDLLRVKDDRVCCSRTENPEILRRNVYRPYSTYTSAQDDRYEAANASWPTGPARNNPSTFVWLYRRGLCDVIDIERKTEYWNNATWCGYWERAPHEGRKDLEKSLDAFVNLRATFTLTERAKRLRSWLERRYLTPRVGTYVDNFVRNGTRFEREEYSLEENWHFFHLARSYEIPIGEVVLERRKRS